MKHDVAERRRRSLCRTMRNMTLPLMLVCAAVVAAACDDTSGPEESDTIRPENGLLILEPADDSPPLVTLDTSFVATRGEDARLRIDYEPVPPATEGERFLELEIDELSLLRYPPGHPRAGSLFAAGDTITIRVTVDPTTLSATLEPSGLEFSPTDPAELELRYNNADEDFDDDGDEDPELEDVIDMWRQETPGDPWERVGNIKDADADRVRANLTEFSRYALGI